MSKIQCKCGIHAGIHHTAGSKRRVGRRHERPNRPTSMKTSIGCRLYAASASRNVFPMGGAKLSGRELVNALGYRSRLCYSVRISKCVFGVKMPRRARARLPVESGVHECDPRAWTPRSTAERPARAVAHCAEPSVSPRNACRTWRARWCAILRQASGSTSGLRKRGSSCAIMVAGDMQREIHSVAIPLSSATDDIPLS